LNLAEERAAIRHVASTQSLIQASLLGEAVEHGPAAVFVADEDGRYVAVNQAACALVGYTRDELLGMNVADLVSGGGRLTQWERMVEEGSISGSAAIRHKDGSHIRFAYVAGATKVAGMPLYVSVGTTLAS
jgi:PAS domain S-box-containing protein